MSEKTRVENFIRKQVEIDLSNMREVADHFRQLDEIMKLAKKQSDALKKVLVENEVEEFFIEDEQKVVFQEGRVKTFIDVNVLVNNMTMSDFLSVATVTETALKNHDDGDELIALAKVTLDEKTAPSVKVAKMTKKELQEMA